MGWLGRGLAIAAALLMAGIAAVALGLDALARTAIERASGQALGVETRVGSVSLQPLRGSFRLSDLEVGNPPGFEAPRFLALASASGQLELRRLSERRIEIPSLVLEGLEVVLEQGRGRSNASAILDHIGGAAGDPPASGAAGPGWRFAIRDLRIERVSARVGLVQGVGRAGQLQLQIPEIRLRDVGAADAGVTLEELSRVVTRSVLRAIARRAEDLPGQLARDLTRGLAGAAGRDLSDRVERALGGGVGRAFESLGGLLGRQSGE